MPAVEPFIKRLGVTRLQTFLDPLGRIAKPEGGDAPTPSFGACRFPTSSTVTGGSLATSGYITREVEWTSEQGRAFLDYYANG